MEKLKGRPPVHSTELIQRIYELYDEGYGYRRIAKILGVHKSTPSYYVLKRRKAEKIEKPATSEQN